MAANRRGARTGFADVAAEQQQVDDLLDRGHTPFLLRQPHCPGDDDLIGFEVAGGQFVDLFDAQPGGLQDGVFIQLGEVQLELLEAFAVLLEERVIQDGPGVPGPRRRGRVWRRPGAGAMSPPRRIWMNWSAISVPWPMMPLTCWGFLYLSGPPPAGLTATISAPLSLASSRAVSMRGWLVPGFWPMMMIRSALPKSS